MLGLRLGELEASDMVDVLHYFFEEDNNMTSGEQAEAKNKTRTNLYSTMYNRPYKYAYGSAGTTPHFDTEDVDPGAPTPTDDIKPFNPKAQPAKAYVAPTKQTNSSKLPFGDILDSPLK